ncbi:hypothetical protein RHMOL_Rhmol06G0217500 [Rhododendron molle]|uniref:Uncharacterized protein n=1 Tax=Rhododendron molle TaxID=49168 RepID=A0ACC0NGX4_RHOML|nr:hypothetical protein RHMOL_Rhmol06G0217500 [Rhododendron molle]
METRASKKMKQKSELKERNSRRRVGDLPDELLRHIFSLLPCKSIVQTSVLSKHWNHLSLWRSHPHLDFSHPSLDSTAKDFIPSMLSRRQPDSNIITFRLSSPVFSSCLLDCVELDVHLDCVVDLPPSLFSCNTLRVLTLNHQNPYPNLRASCPVILAVKENFICSDTGNHKVQRNCRGQRPLYLHSVLSDLCPSEGEFSRGKTSLIDEVIEEAEWETDDEEEVDVEGIEGYKSESSDDDDEIQDEVLGSENDD